MNWLLYIFGFPLFFSLYGMNIGKITQPSNKMTAQDKDDLENFIIFISLVLSILCWIGICNIISRFI